MSKSTRIVAILFVVLLPMFGFAQIHLGIKGGATLSTIDFNFATEGVHSLGGYRPTYSGSVSKSTFQYQKVQGYCIGVSIEKPLDERLGAVLELQYSQKGFHETEGFNYQGQSVVLNLTTVYSYIDMPILLNYSLMKKGNMGLVGEIGLNIGYALWGQQTYKTDTYANTYDYVFSSENFNRLDLSVLAGLGFYYNMGANRITFNTRYAFGITDTERSDVLNKSPNRVLSFILGYQFKL
jgi:hypothetical protein